MNNLRIIDVSSVVYTGASSEFFAERTSYGFPVGGIHFLMRQICTALVNYDGLILCFDSPSFRCKLLPDYKAGRQKRPDVFSQIELSYDFLMKSGIYCEKFDGYEADDIISWAVDQNVANFMEVEIVGNDHDLCHNVREKVRFKSIKPGSPCVFVSSFEKYADPGSYTKFNTISAKKALCGCKSDHVKPLVLNNGMKGIEIYKKFLDFLTENSIACTYENTVNWELLCTFAKRSGLFTESDFSELLQRVKIIYPANCPEDTRIIPVTLASVNADALAKFLTLVNDYDSLRCFKYPRANLREEDKQVLFDKVNKLKSGEYAVDHNLERTPLIKARSLNLDCFEKEF